MYLLFCTCSVLSVCVAVYLIHLLLSVQHICCYTLNKFFSVSLLMNAQLVPLTCSVAVFCLWSLVSYSSAYLLASLCVCVCACVCVCVCVCACMCVCVCVCIHVQHVCLWVCVHMSIGVLAHTCVCYRCCERQSRPTCGQSWCSCMTSTKSLTMPSWPSWPTPQRPGVRVSSRTSSPRSVLRNLCSCFLHWWHAVVCLNRLSELEVLLL